METVAIVGVGLIGGSFALAIRRAGFGGSILGVSSPSTIAEALRLGVIDEGVTLEQACARADLVYLSQPILRIIEVLPRVAAHLRPGALVTDAGSTKARIVEAARKSMPAGAFLGGHPMAGKESRGVAAAEAGLFEGRPYILTPTDAGPSMEAGVCKEFLHLLLEIGANPIELDPDEHDRIVAFTSHVPQILSTSLASALSEISVAERIAGPSVIDLTRLALSPYDIWSDIFATNRTNISNALQCIIDNLSFVKANLTSDLSEEFRRAQMTAKRLRKKRLEEI